MKQNSNLAILVKCCSLISCVLCVLFTMLHHVSPRSWLLSLAITAGTSGYHFVMRLTVGRLVSAIFTTGFDPQSFWFRPKSFERKLYRVIRVRHWKGRLPTYSPEKFSFEHNTPEQIIQNSCEAELVHEWIMCASFLPLTASVIWGELPVFLITSLLAACFDGCFVIMQRYNRPRLQQYLKRRGKHI